MPFELPSEPNSNFNKDDIRQILANLDKGALKEVLSEDGVYDVSIRP